MFIANVDRQKAEKQTVRQQTVCAAKLAAASQACYMRQSRQLLATMTQFPFLLTQNAGLARTGMSKLKLLARDYKEFGLIERDGTVFCHTLGTNTTGEIVPKAFARQVLEKPVFAMSELHHEPGSGQPVLQFAYPIFEPNHRLARIMYAALKVSRLSFTLADVPLPEGGVVTVTDRNGNIVARHPSPQNSLGERLPSFPFVEQALAQTNNVHKSAYFESARHLYAVSLVSDGTTPFLYV